ncbi:DUF4158 domain-containing protein [Streptomyces sp. CSDS2]|nr:DUF4158 domain-containing protein [Streptomyces sp. CSDS2]MDN3259209.1 DUF4158 domain-containing protein [Streptomyces sp. CSDS2]
MAFTEVPTRPELERFFFLDDDDRVLIAPRRTDAHRLGMAVQIRTVRYIGRFLGEDPLAVPWEVVEYLAGQLGIADASCVKATRRREPRVGNRADSAMEVSTLVIGVAEVPALGHHCLLAKAGGLEAEGIAERVAGEPGWS